MQIAVLCRHVLLRPTSSFLHHAVLVVADAPRYFSSIPAVPKQQKLRSSRKKEDGEDASFLQSLSLPSSMMQDMERNPQLVEEMESAASESTESTAAEAKDAEVVVEEETPESEEEPMKQKLKKKEKEASRPLLITKYPNATRIIEDWLYRFDHRNGWFGGIANGGIRRIRGFGFLGRIRSTSCHGAERNVDWTRRFSDEDCIEKVLEASEKLDPLLHHRQIRSCAALRALFVTNAWRAWKSFQLGLTRNARFPLVIAGRECFIFQMHMPYGVAYALVDDMPSVHSLLRTLPFHAKLNPRENLNTIFPHCKICNFAQNAINERMIYLLYPLPSGYKLIHVNRINLDCRLDNLRIVPSLVDDEAALQRMLEDKEQLMKEYKLPSELFDPIPSNERIVESIEEFFSAIQKAVDSLEAINSWEASFAKSFVQKLGLLKKDLLERAITGRRSRSVSLKQSTDI